MSTSSFEEPLSEIAPTSSFGEVDATHARHLVIECLKKASDGSQPLQSIRIATYVLLEGVVYYEIEVVSNNVRWNISRRFQEFDELNQLIESRVRSTKNLPPFPQKYIKTLTDHFNDHFVKARLSLLDNYLRKLLSSSKLRNNDAVLSFLTPSEDDIVNKIDLKDSVFEPRLYEEDEEKSEKRDLSNSTYSFSPSNRIHSNPNYSTDSSEHENHFRHNGLDDDSFENCEEVTNVTIPATQTLKKDHVVYQINVENTKKDANFSLWTVHKRYVEFFNLDRLLRQHFARWPALTAKLPKLPAREPKMLVNHLHNRFIERRRILLEYYMKALLAIPQVSCRPEFLEFLQCN